jgi:hypothetical protein
MFELSFRNDIFIKANDCCGLLTNQIFINVINSLFYNVSVIDTFHFNYKYYTVKLLAGNSLELF